MEETMQFDSFLGGSYNLPAEVPIMDLISSRASEIAAMTHSIENPQQTKLIFQKLPVYMRRRVMSHNANRLPRRLREAHLRQMAKSGLPPESKRPSRKYRRRPNNLLLAYNRRKRNKVWLETHIWHAKRFHMIEKWGYKIASHAIDKCFKANYRAVTKCCLMQDLSYYCCIEINGPENMLKETLKAHCDPTKLTIAAKIYINGNREGILMFFTKNGYPKCPIGNIRFLWRPDQSNINRTIWIWVHPAFYDDVLNQLVSSFEFNLCSATESEECTDVYYKNERNCQMLLLKNTLNRFRLYGPLTLNVLTSALRLPNIKSQNNSSSSEYKNSNDIDKEMTDTSNAEIPWHIKYYEDGKNAEHFKTQKQLWQMLGTMAPGELPRNIVLGFTVLDPRFATPKKRKKCEKQNEVSENMLTPPANSNYSAIWDIDIRNKVTKSYVPTTEINKLRSQCLVPGISNDDNFSEDVMAKIPLIIIQNPGSDGTGLSSGIDIILPAGWSMPFLLAFVFRCTRVGALRESEAITFENQIVNSSDVNDPDTEAYKREAVNTHKELSEKYFRYPPNRRVNFVKLGISSPFFCKWDILMKEWSNSEEFYVLRDQRILSTLKAIIASKQLNSQLFTKDVQNSLHNENCLVRVKVSVLKRGCPKRFAIICLPSENDLNKLEENKNWAGPVEKLNNDSNQVVRRTLRRNHKQFLKRAKRQRIRRRKTFFNKADEILRKGTCGTNQMDRTKKFIKDLFNSNKEVILKQSEKMSKLYLPDCAKVRYSCDREIMGYVTSGGYSFAAAKGIGIGYITMQSLLTMCSRKSNIVLIRNAQTRQYRSAELDILIC